MSDRKYIDNGACAHGQFREACLDCKDARIASFERELAEMRGRDMCDACAGTGTPTSKLPCMCGGTGRMSDAAYYLRAQLAAAEARAERLREASTYLVLQVKVLARGFEFVLPDGVMAVENALADTAAPSGEQKA